MIEVTSFKELAEKLEANEFNTKCFIGLDTINKDVIGNSYICVEYEADDGIYADNGLYGVINNVSVFLVSKDIREFLKLNSFIRKELGVCGQADREDIYYRMSYDVQLFLKEA